MATFPPSMALRIGLASPEQIRSWSYGEVTRAETINYRTHKPEKDGLLSEQIFGPRRDWSCACGKYTYVHKDGVICEKCGVELAPATVRRERMGHIELAAPVVHPWYIRTIGLLLDLSSWQLSAVLASQRSLILAVDEEQRSTVLAQLDSEADESLQLLATIHTGDLLDAGQYQVLLPRFRSVVQAKTGVEGIRDRLVSLDLARLARDLRAEVEAHGKDRKKAIRRLRVVEAMRSSGQNPAWMVLSVLPVLPPELRPVLQLENGQWASSDLNDLYCRVIHRNTRLKSFIAQQAPEILLNNERRLLQEVCSALLDNAHKKKPVRGSRHQPLKSLTDALQGKQGRFRQNLLGKRVDYSGRSVIVAGPDLLLHECGLPKAMACELFKPFVMRKLLDRHYASSPKRAKRMVERRDPCIWDLLAEVMFERAVLLNRAPTLHRLSIQAFHPRLIEGNAIQLHPLVCSAFNADFDGDQMAVHVPLSQAAQEEAHRLLLSTRNVRHPASGEPAIAPSQEIVLGCFYLTEDRPGQKWAHHIFAESNEALLAHATGHIELHTPILVRMHGRQVYATPPPAERQVPSRGRLETTVGRLLFNEILPEPLHYRNYPMTKDALKALVADCLATCGEDATVRLLDDMKRLGYQYATKSGISFALSDIVMPPERDVLIQQGKKHVEEIDALYHTGEMTSEEWERNEACYRLGLPDIRSLVIGRVLAESAGDLEADTFLNEPLVDSLLASGVHSLRVRSPLYCQTPYGLCRYCYGSDLATGKLVRSGAAVGVIAGQAIGEPGTQLTMRTFHSGGIANNATDITLGLPRVNDLFEVHMPTHPAPLAERSGIVQAIGMNERTGGIRIHFVSTKTEKHEEWTCDIPFRRTLAVQQGQVVEIGTPLVEGPLNPQELFQHLGREAAQQYIINEVRRVTREQGCNLPQTSGVLSGKCSGMLSLLIQKIQDSFLARAGIILRFCNAPRP